MRDSEDFLGDEAFDGTPGPVPRGPVPPPPSRRISTYGQLAAAILLTTILAGGFGYLVGRSASAPSAPPATTSIAKATETPDAGQTSAVASPLPSLSRTPVTSETPAASPSGTANDYEALLATIPIKGRAPMTDYDRVSDFGQTWKDMDRNGCDTRNDILRRDLTDAVLKPNTNGCVVLTGTLDDPYTGMIIDFERGEQTSAEVQIDHIVALADAWQKGAQQWTQSKREEFANDPRNLLAVDGPTNQQKGAGDAATWLPPNRGYWCAYAESIVEIKAAYGVWTTAAEHARLEDLLQNCP
jgi:hypothetical protein